MLSIIIPTLNEEDYLQKLLESIRSQDFKDYEIIVADGGSNDQTVDIAKHYNCKVVTGGTLPVGRNNGAKTATGEIFLFLDADVLLPNSQFIGKALREFERRHLGVAGFVLVPVKGKKVDYFFYNLWAQFNQKLFCHAASAIMAKKEVHESIGGFDESIKFIEDYPYTRKAAKKSKFGFINIPVFTSMRRFEKDGRLATYLRYFLGTLHILFLGPIRSNIFNYKFSHYDKEKQK